MRMDQNINPPEDVRLPELSGPFKRIMTITHKIADAFNEADFESANPNPKDVENPYWSIHYNIAALFCFYKSMVASGHMDDRWLDGGDKTGRAVEPKIVKAVPKDRYPHGIWCSLSRREKWRCTLFALPFPVFGALLMELVRVLGQ